MSYMFMNKTMAGRFDLLFGQYGSLLDHADIRKKMFERLDNPAEKAGDTSFHPEEVKHILSALECLAGNPEAQATLMSALAFAQMKNDCAG